MVQWPSGYHHERGSPLTRDLGYRPHNATEVYVTGTFDDWGRTVKLEKNGDVFEREVQLPKADEKVYFKVCWTQDILSHCVRRMRTNYTPCPVYSYDFWSAPSHDARVYRS